MTHTLHITVLRREVIQENWTIEVDDAHFPADLDEAFYVLDEPSTVVVSCFDNMTYQPNNREVIAMQAVCSP